jgi:hypothetical protein
MNTHSVRPSSQTGGHPLVNTRNIGEPDIDRDSVWHRGATGLVHGLGFVRDIYHLVSDHRDSYPAG